MTSDLRKLPEGEDCVMNGPHSAVVFRRKFLKVEQYDVGGL